MDKKYGIEDMFRLGRMTRKQKAEALVEWGVSASIEEAYMFLEDMGE